jgi:hypothetical protein
VRACKKNFVADCPGALSDRFIASFRRRSLPYVRPCRYTLPHAGGCSFRRR